MMNSLRMTTFAALCLTSWACAATGDPSPTPAAPPAHGLRIAVFDLKVDAKTGVEAEALTDQIMVVCSTLPGIKLVDRKELARVADEHKMSLSGLTNDGESVTLGRLAAASHILVGRLSTIGQSNYLILKLINVETTEQRLISVRASVTEGIERLLDSMITELATALAATPPPVPVDDADELRKAADWLIGKTIVVDISESHVNRPLADPAAATTAYNRLRDLGASVILPEDPATGWREALLATGKYLDQSADYLLSGEGTSSFAAEIQGMVSCRARVELRLIPVPGRKVQYVETGVGAEVDLAEALAAKAALEEATDEAVRAVINAGARERSGQP